MNTRWAERYLGVPYVESGTDFNGADCWGLYSLILAEEGIGYPEIEASDRSRLNAIRHTISNQIAGGAWIRVWVPADGSLDPKIAAPLDGVVIAANSGSTAGLHIGCALGDGRLIQTTKVQGPHIMSLFDPRIEKRIIGIYRPAALRRGVAA